MKQAGIGAFHRRIQPEIIGIDQHPFYDTGQLALGAGSQARVLDDYRGHNLKSFRIVGIALLVLGTLGLVYGGFNYTKATHEAKLGPLRLAVTEQAWVNFPSWAGVAAIAAGGLLLLYAGKRR